MAIYTRFTDDPRHAVTRRVDAKGNHWTQVNDMWTATHGDQPYRPDARRGFRKHAAPRTFRYVR